MSTDWLGFWDGPHFIYVNARHKAVHYRLIAQQIAALIANPDARVLDYGSGEALHAEIIAGSGRRQILRDRMQHDQIERVLRQARDLVRRDHADFSVAGKSRRQRRAHFRRGFA